VQHAVKGVQQQLVGHGRRVPARLATGLGDADDHFTGDRSPAGIEFERKRQNVGRTAHAEELLVQSCHANVADQRQRKFAQRRPEEAVGRQQVFP
jgi:hypothetical protein